MTLTQCQQKLKIITLTKIVVVCYMAVYCITCKGFLLFCPPYVHACVCVSICISGCVLFLTNLTLISSHTQSMNTWGCLCVFNQSTYHRATNISVWRVLYVYLLIKFLSLFVIIGDCELVCLKNIVYLCVCLYQCWWDIVCLVQMAGGRMTTG